MLLMAFTFALIFSVVEVAANVSALQIRGVLKCRRLRVKCKFGA